MKKAFTQKSLFLASSATLVFSAYAATPVANYYSIRSQGCNPERHYAGRVNQLFRPDQPATYGALWTTINYGSSFRPSAIAHTLFGDALSCTRSCPALTISGSTVSDRGAHDLLADYFGLPTDFTSTVYFKPHIDNCIVDCNFYLGLNEWARGLYATVHAPIVHSRWDLNMCEKVTTKGTSGYPAGYFSPQAIPRTALLENFSSFASCQNAPDIVDTTLTCSTITFQPLSYARLNPCRQRKTGIAELTFQLGWDFIESATESHQYHAGIALHTSAPTGTRPKGRYLFEPIVGNGHHWTFGGTLSGHYAWVLDHEQNHHIGLYGSIQAEHLFKAHQRRSFDLKGKPLSRYMLAQKIAPNTGTAPRLHPDTFPEYAFAHEYSPVANISTLDVDVSVGVQANLQSMLQYTHGGFTADMGYGFWAQTCQKCELACGYPSDLELITEHSWAVKGDAYTVGFENGTDTPVRLAATQENATIHNGTNAPVATVAQPASTNPGIDFPQLAVSNNSVAVNDAAGNQTRSSNPISYITLNDIDLNQGRTKARSHKLFGHLGYAWDKAPHWSPFFGIGAEVEFGHPSKCTESCDTSCTDCCSCVTSALSQWNCWAQGGISF